MNEMCLMVEVSGGRWMDKTNGCSESMFGGAANAQVEWMSGIETVNRQREVKREGKKELNEERSGDGLEEKTW